MTKLKALLELLTTEQIDEVIEFIEDLLERDTKEVVRQNQNTSNV
jgi:hypothetical protein